MLTARQLYFEAVKVGDELPPLGNPLYIDEPLAKNAGFPSALAPGTIAMGFLAELSSEWVRGARLRKFAARFVKIVWPGDVLTARGRVVERRFEEAGRYAIDLELWAENQRGELVVKGAATFQLYYSAEDEARQRQGQGPLVVTREEEEARLAKLSRALPPRPAAPVSRTLAPPRPVVPAPVRQPGPAPGPSHAARPAPAPAPAKPAARPAPKAAKPAKKARAGARARSAPRKARPKPRPHPAKRARADAASRARARRPAKKPSGKKKRR
jgi:hypothetical protein